MPLQGFEFSRFQTVYALIWVNATSDLFPERSKFIRVERSAERVLHLGWHPLPLENLAGVTLGKRIGMHIK